MLELFYVREKRMNRFIFSISRNSLFFLSAEAVKFFNHTAHRWQWMSTSSFPSLVWSESPSSRLSYLIANPKWTLPDSARTVSFFWCSFQVKWEPVEIGPFSMRNKQLVEFWKWKDVESIFERGRLSEELEAHWFKQYRDCEWLIRKILKTRVVVKRSHNLDLSRIKPSGLDQKDKGWWKHMMWKERVDIRGETELPKRFAWQGDP